MEPPAVSDTPPEGAHNPPWAEPVAVGLGANLGDKGEALRAAVAAMATLPATRLLAVSSLYRSAPVDATGPDYLNAVALLATRLQPLQLLHALQAIELAAGRERPYRNAPRTLDLDIELWADARLDLPDLTIPHPRMYQRAFVLQPLAELLPAQVSAAQLQAVAAQQIERLPEREWWKAV